MVEGEEKEEEEKWLFKKGSEVEVCLEDEGFRGSWYSATVLRSSRKNNKILVQFHTLKEDERPTSRPLRELVNSILVRPIPPREISPRRFKVSQEVDAFHNDGWWEGIVISVLKGDRYSLFFRCSREQLEFHESDLRLHREWLGSKNWLPPFQQPPPSPSSASTTTY